VHAGNRWVRVVAWQHIHDREASLHKILAQTGSVGDSCSEQTRTWDLALADAAAVFLAAVNTSPRPNRFARVLGEGGTASFAPDKRNIHGLETEWPRAVLLTATALPHRDEERAWYYPVPLRPPDRSSILVNCVRRRPTVDHLKANRGRGSESAFLKE